MFTTYKRYKKCLNTNFVNFNTIKRAVIIETMVGEHTVISQIGFINQKDINEPNVVVYRKLREYELNFCNNKNFIPE